ncbi:AAA domain-containing protein [Corallococcus exiguus]|uniref:AAA family ATPase n=1 Tax=Corallococcus exiguus TaxID=83462 RepID=UPI001474FE59|nr:MoxR family ATPase [Corallococcus exiguus]NNB99117.1 AAA domain-containing protein [Corallococcus exiguus]
MTLQFNRTAFDPETVRRLWKTQDTKKLSDEQSRARRYEERDDIVLAVNAAIVTRRPLLVYGPPGSGKSSLAGFVAEVLGWRYYEHVITSRTQALDLLWGFDAIRRLSDAQAKTGSLPANHDYVEPGVLWWAFESGSALRRGAGTGVKLKARPKDPARWGKSPHAVVLLDEIDKADPFVPNDLLIPLDRGSFDVTELNAHIELPRDRRVLLVITTNGERELAPAFLRRCVQLELKAPDLGQLQRIAELHHGPDKEGLYEPVANALLQLQRVAREKRVRPPSTAEFLDAIQACRELRIRPGMGKEWELLTSGLLEKQSTFAGG